MARMFKKTRVELELLTDIDMLLWNVIILISVNHTLILSYSQLTGSKKIWFVGEISNKLPDGLFGTNVYNTLESWW